MYKAAKKLHFPPPLSAASLKSGSSLIEPRLSWRPYCIVGDRRNVTEVDLIVREAVESSHCCLNLLLSLLCNVFHMLSLP